MLTDLQTIQRETVEFIKDVQPYLARDQLDVTWYRDMLKRVSFSVYNISE